MRLEILNSNDACSQWRRDQRSRLPSRRARLPSLRELEPLCQKPGHRVGGNWMARRVARPMALHVTRLVLPLGIGAHAVTAAAALVGLAAAVAFAYGPSAGLITGAALLQLWYLLDHVDGQVARFRGTASVGGIYVDYLMHYVVHGACPLGLGWGLFATTGEAAWLFAGASWSAGMVMLGLGNDCLYKAFFARLRHSGGTHVVQGAESETQQPPWRPSWRQPIRCAAYVMQKACEIHVIINTLSVIALVALFWPVAGTALAQLSTGLLAGLVPLVAVLRVLRAVAQGRPEREFAAWFPDIDPRQAAPRPNREANRSDNPRDAKVNAATH